MNEVLAPLFYVFRNDPDQNNAVCVMKLLVCHSLQNNCFMFLEMNTARLQQVIPLKQQNTFIHHRISSYSSELPVSGFMVHSGTISNIHSTVYKLHVLFRQNLLYRQLIVVNSYKLYRVQSENSGIFSPLQYEVFYFHMYFITNYIEDSIVLSTDHCYFACYGPFLTSINCLCI